MANDLPPGFVLRDTAPPPGFEPQSSTRSEAIPEQSSDVKLRLTEEEKFKRLTPEEQAQAGAGIGPNVPADVPSIPVPEEQMSSAEFAEQRRQERTLGEHLEREILPTVGSIIGAVAPQAKLLKGAGALIKLGTTALGAGVGGSAGEAAQMTNETLRGDMDAPKTAGEVGGRLAEEFAWGAGGELVGFGLIKGVGAGAKAWNKGVSKLEDVGHKIPVVRDVWKSSDKRKFKVLKDAYEDNARILADRATENLTKQELTSLVENTIQNGKEVFNTTTKSILKNLDQTPIVNADSIKSFAQNRLTRFATGKTSEGMTVVVRPESKQLASSVLESLDKIPSKLPLAESFVLKNELLDEAIGAASTLGDDALANHFKAIQNRLGTVMKESAERAGGVTEEAYKKIIDTSDTIKKGINDEFIGKVFLKNPGAIGEELFSNLPRQRIHELRNQVTKLDGGEEAWRLARAGYGKTIAERIINTETGALNREAFKNILSDSGQWKQIQAVFGKEHSSTLRSMKETIESQARKPGDYLIEGSTLYDLLKSKAGITAIGATAFDPTGISQTIVGGVTGIAGITAAGRGVAAGARAIGAGKDATIDVLGRMLSDPAKAEILKKALSIKASAPNAARVMAQLNMAVGEAVQEIDENREATPITSVAEGSEGAEDLPPGFVLRPNTGLPPGFKPRERSVPEKKSSDERSSAINKEEEWIQKYQQVNPGVSRQEAIEEGKRLGKVPKNYKSPSRGIRNNNPGNIEKSDINWQGKIKGSDKRFETFKTPEDGLRAMTVNLRTYQNKYGLNTVSEIISRWAPPSENATGSYINTVARRMGVKANEKLDLNDPKTMKKLVEAIIQVENGNMPYEEATLTKGVSKALA